MQRFRKKAGNTAGCRPKLTSASAGVGRQRSTGVRISDIVVVQFVVAGATLVNVESAKIVLRFRKKRVTLE